MTPDEAATVLAKCAAVDRRTVGRADVLAWHEIIGELPLPAALEAVKRWYTNHRDWIMPSDVMDLARQIQREQRIEANHRRQLEAAEHEPPTDSRPLTDRSAEIQAFVRSVRDILPAGDPDKLRHASGYWRQVREDRERQERAEPNPLYDPAAQAALLASEGDQA